MRVHITELVNGDRLTSDTFNSYGLHVLSKGTILHNLEIARLFQHQIDYVEIEERNGSSEQHRTLETTVSPKWLPAVEPIYESAVKCFEALFTKALASGNVNDQEVTAILEPLINNLQMERDVVSMLLLLNTKDDYTYQHSVQVGMLSYYLATWVGFSNKEAAIIGKAGFLHDIGKCRIPNEILNKPDKLTDDEFDEIKKHTIYGHEIISNSIDMPEIAFGALQHHERMDGSGYPHGLKGNEIHPYAKIIGIVDVYSAMISNRVYQNKRDLLSVLKELNRLSFSTLDPQFTHSFIKHMMPNFIGKRAELTTGEIGLIVMTHPTELFHPLIQIENDFVDMTVNRQYEIKHIYI